MGQPQTKFLNPVLDRLNKDSDQNLSAYYSAKPAAPRSPRSAPIYLICSECQSENRPNTKFCTSCGSFIPPVCECGKPVEEGSILCDDCAPPSRAPPKPSRKSSIATGRTKLICPKCNTSNLEWLKKCSSCGASLKTAQHVKTSYRTSSVAVTPANIGRIPNAIRSVEKQKKFLKQKPHPPSAIIMKTLFPGDGSCDSRVEPMVRSWIEAVSGKKLIGSFHESLASGVILCELVNNIKPNTVISIGNQGQSNIALFIKGLEQLGVPQKELFSPEDIRKNTNLTLILKCMTTLAMVALVVPTFQGPYMEFPQDSKNKMRSAEEVASKSPHLIRKAQAEAEAKAQADAKLAAAPPKRMWEWGNNEDDELLFSPTMQKRLKVFDHIKELLANWLTQQEETDNSWTEISQALHEMERQEGKLVRQKHSYTSQLRALTLERKTVLSISQGLSLVVKAKNEWLNKREKGDVDEDELEKLKADGQFLEVTQNEKMRLHLGRRSMQKKEKTPDEKLQKMSDDVHRQLDKAISELVVKLTQQFKKEENQMRKLETSERDFLKKDFNTRIKEADDKERARDIREHMELTLIALKQRHQRAQQSREERRRRQQQHEEFKLRKNFEMYRQQFRTAMSKKIQAEKEAQIQREHDLQMENIADRHDIAIRIANLEAQIESADPQKLPNLKQQLAKAQLDSRIAESIKGVREEFAEIAAQHKIEASRVDAERQVELENISTAYQDDIKQLQAKKDAYDLKLAAEFSLLQKLAASLDIPQAFETVAPEFAKIQQSTASTGFVDEIEAQVTRVEKWRAKFVNANVFRSAKARFKVDKQVLVQQLGAANDLIKSLTADLIKIKATEDELAQSEALKAEVVAAMASNELEARIRAKFEEEARAMKQQYENELKAERIRIADMMKADKANAAKKEANVPAPPPLNFDIPAPPPLKFDIPAPPSFDVGTDGDDFASQLGNVKLQSASQNQSGPDEHTSLLDAIQKGTKLKSAAERKLPVGGASNKTGGIVGAMSEMITTSNIALHMANLRSAISPDEDEDEEDDDFDESDW